MPSFKYLNGTNTIGTGTYKFKHINYEAPPTNTYLTFSSPTSFTIAKHADGRNNGTIQYSTDKTTWSTFTTTAVTSVLINSNYEVYFRGTSNTYVKNNDWASFFAITGSNVSCNGNIETLLDYATVDAGNHPTMGFECYRGMFYRCTSLTSAPALPATTLAEDCYKYMFSRCTSLTSAPALPATTLASSCYKGMFSHCTSLTSAPSLPATTLADGCYQDMFNGCTSLTSAPSLPATTLTPNCYYQMFYGCTSLKLSAAQTDKYVIPYRIPTSGTGTVGADSLSYMFNSTGGTFTGKPSINTTYYLWSE